MHILIRTSLVSDHVFPTMMNSTLAALFLTHPLTTSRTHARFLSFLSLSFSLTHKRIFFSSLVYAHALVCSLFRARALACSCLSLSRRTRCLACKRAQARAARRRNVGALKREWVKKNMLIYIHIYIYISIYIHICIYMYMYMYVYKYVYKYAFVFICTYTYTHTYKYM